METITLTQLKEMCANHEHVSLVKGYYGKDLKYYGLESEPPKIIDLVFDWNEPFEHYVYGFGSVDSYMVYFRDAIGKKHHLQLFKHPGEKDWTITIRKPGRHHQSNDFYFSKEEAQKEVDRRHKETLEYLKSIEDRKRKAIETINKEIEKLEEIKGWYSD